ncbi:MAG: glycosyltransferase family 2 protein [Myxococcales bacterium]|nr:glycosyltransferase family 2 protein [Myxococcales bacterium]
MPPTISIVICCHNEEASLPDLIDALVEHALPHPQVIEALIVDDHSDDRSPELLAAAAAQHPKLRHLRLPARGGQTGCFRAAFPEVRGEMVIRMDADLQDDPRDLSLFIDRINDGAELVMGLREARKHARAVRIAAALYDIGILMLFDTPLHSNSGSFVALKTSLMQDIPWRPNDHRYLPLIAIRRGAQNISEVIVRHRPRLHGQSHYKIYKKLTLGAFEVMRFIVRLRRGYYDLALPRGR